MAFYGYGGYNGLGEDCDADYGEYDQYYDYEPEYEDYEQPGNAASGIVHQLLRQNDVVMFAFTYCGPCKKTKTLLDQNLVPYIVYDLDTDPYITKQQYFDALEPLSGIRSVPQVFIHGEFFGGSQEVKYGLERGQIQEMVQGRAQAVISGLLQENDVVLFAYTYCGPCQRTKTLLDRKGIPYLVYNLDTDPNISQSEYADALEPLSGIRTVPQLFINGQFFGDSHQIKAGVHGGRVQQMCGHAAATVHQLLRHNDVIMFATSICNYSRKAKALLEDNDIPYMVHYIDTDPYIDKKQYQDALEQLSGIRTLPQLFIHGRFYGDSQKTRRGLETGEIQHLCT